MRRVYWYRRSIYNISSKDIAPVTRSIKRDRVPMLRLCAALCGISMACLAGAADTPTSSGTEPASAAPAEHAPTPGAPAGAGSDNAVGGGPAKAGPAHSRFAPDRFAARAGLYYRTTWGIDSIVVRLVESGELVRFSYRVVDPDKARVLNDKQAEAKLDDPKAGVSLVVPTMEKIGQLRQTGTPQAGKSYWMTFSNKGRRVARGDRVDVVIGQFRAANLVVD